MKYLFRNKFGFQARNEDLVLLIDVVGRPIYGSRVGNTQIQQEPVCIIIDYAW